MGLKEQFLQALDEVPGGIANFTETAIPTLATISDPSDVDSAIIAQGKLAYNLNLILKEFEGMTPIELFLRIGQRNTVVKALLLAALQYVSQTELHDFNILLPESGIVHTPGQIDFTAEVTTGLDDLTAFYVDVTGPENKIVQLAQNEENKNRFEGQEEFTQTGLYTAVFTAEFGDYIVTKDVEIDIQP